MFSSTTRECYFASTLNIPDVDDAGFSGVMWPPIDLLTEDGYDLQWGTNVLGHWYLTELLMPALIAGVETSPDHHARVITTSSSGAYQGTIKWDTLKDTPARRKQSTANLYYQSKFVSPSNAYERGVCACY